MPIYRGLNIAKGMIDVDDPVEALRNLGLNIDDLNLISGLTSANVDIKDFHSMANLTEDQEKVFSGMLATAQKTGQLVETLPDISVPMNFNILINSQLAGSAIKYNYLDFSGVDGTNWKAAKADISTSRVSSWSPIGPEATPDSVIFYGGEVNSKKGTISYTSISTTKQPVKKAFRAEVPTHILKMKFNGVEQNVLAMKGIPLTFDSSFRDCDLTASVVGVQDSSGATIPITWRVTNLDSTATIYNSGDGTSENPGSVGVGTLSTPAIYTFRDSQSRPRRIEFFYNPSKIEQLKMVEINISQWTNVSLPNLKILSFERNDLSVIPEFRDDIEAVGAAKHGLTSTAGLAPTLEEINLTGNNLARAELSLQGSTNLTNNDNVLYSTANAQLNRLPLTMKKITVNGCFSDSTEVDLTQYVNLENFSMGVTYDSDLRRIMTGGTVMPKILDTTIANTDFNNWDTYNYSTTEIIIDSAVAFKLYGGTPTADALATVKYLNGAYNNAGTIELPTNYPAGAITGGLVPNTVYTLKAKGTGNRYEVFLGATQLNALVSGTGEPGAHCFKACDASGNILYDDTKGIKKYSIENQPFYEQLPTGIMTSSKLQELSFASSWLSSNSELPIYSSSGFSDAQRDAQSSDRSITLRSTEITKFSSTNNRTGLGSHNIINMSGKTNLTEYTQSRCSLRSSVRKAERTANAKFDNCPALTRFDVVVTNCLGNWQENSMFNDKPDLTYIDVRYTHMDARLSDSVFGPNTTKITNLYVAGATYGMSSNDFLGINGESGFTGKSLKSLVNLRRLYMYNMDRACIRFVDNADDTKFLDLASNLNLQVLYCADGGVTGKLPDITNNTKLYYMNFKNNRSNLHVRWAQPGVKHTIVSFYNQSNLNNQSNNNLQMWADIGWTNVNPVTGESQGTNGNTEPAVGDTFVYQAVPIATTALVQGKRYRIYDIGNTTVDDWNTITGQNKANISDYIDHSVAGTYVNYSFVAPAAPSLAGVTGTGTVRPDGYDRVLTAGLDESLPAWINPRLQWLYIQNNSIPGQFPTMTLPYLFRVWANKNKFTGTFPDFSLCLNLRDVRLQDNQISGYVSGSLSLNKYLTKINLKNNKLPAISGTALINDLYENYLLRRRGGVIINLLGQNAASGDHLTESRLNNDGTTGDLSTANKLAFLRNAGWTIQLES
ncbi:hypothetical protein N9000_00090 [bacterium]|nr:hypothetical protein [bacterium]